jgi:hypothetical protein
MSPLRFAYQPVRISRKRPPYLPPDAVEKLRPFVRIRVQGPDVKKAVEFDQAHLDTGADITTFPADWAGTIAVQLLPASSVQQIGQSFPASFADVEIQIRPNGSMTWQTRARFSGARKYPLLGISGFFQYVDATFYGHAHRVELLPNDTFLGKVTAAAATAVQPAGQAGLEVPNCLRFAYQEHPRGAGPLLPLIPVSLTGQTSSARFDQAYVDTGTDVCLFPLDYGHQIGVQFLDDGTWTIVWGGERRKARYGKVQLELTDGTSTWSWPAGVAFLDVPPDKLRFPLLAHAGFLEFMDATFFGAKQELCLATNPSFPGTTTRIAPISKGP